MKTDYVPKALREVWAWKDEIYQEVKHLPTRDALRAILDKAEETAARLGFGVSDTSKKRRVVAESPGIYEVARPQADRTESPRKKRNKGTTTKG